MFLLSIVTDYPRWSENEFFPLPMSLTPNISRRKFTGRIATGLLGLTVAPRIPHAWGAVLPSAGEATADSVIYLFMDGGMSHLDTFDLRSASTGICTNVPGIHITDKLPRLASQMTKIAQIRSMTNTETDHAKAKRQARPDFFPKATERPEPPLPGLGKESRKICDMYGNSPFGKNCLIARKMVERGSRFAEVHLSGWDTHTDVRRRVASNCAILDQGLSALLGDLEARGMLKRTLVVLTSEFGRSPKINGFGGRNHNPSAFTSLLMGGGVTGGAVFGKTDTAGGSVSENPVSFRDFNATIAHALGINHQGTETVAANQNANTAGVPVTSIFC